MMFQVGSPEGRVNSWAGESIAGAGTETAHRKFYLRGAQGRAGSGNPRQRTATLRPAVLGGHLSSAYAHVFFYHFAFLSAGFGMV